jgi:hypothetical protein
MLNPYIAFPNFARSTASLDNLILLSALYFAAAGSLPFIPWDHFSDYIIGRRSNAMVFMALATHLSPTAIFVVLPASMMLVDSSKQTQTHKPLSNWKALVPTISEYSIYMAFLAAVSTLVMGDISWIGPTWGSV